MDRKYIKKYVDFLLKYSTYTDPKQIEEYLVGHFMFNTIIVLEDKKGVYALCRWNMIDKENCHVLDLVIRKDMRNRGVMEDVIRRGMALFPDVKYLHFERGYDDGLQKKELQKYSIGQFLNRERRNENAQV